MAKKEKKITNKQGAIPNPRKPHHKQGLTCDCKQCGVEFTQYHPKHVYCSPVCQWDYEGRAHAPTQCSGCGCVDDVAVHGSGYVCRICKMLKLNPKRTDVTRRVPC
jgi:hypothetical protein